MPTHTVAPGETLLDVARQHGFGQIDSLLEDPGNTTLAGRTHPNLLIPGETVTIPEAKPFSIQKPTGSFHRIELKALVTKLGAKIGQRSGKALSPKSVTLSLDGKPALTLALDGEGAWEKEVPSSTRRARLEVTFDAADDPTWIWELDVGALSRADDPDGATARLKNLGYYREPSSLSDIELKSAIEEFQCDQGLAISGKLDGTTLAKLVEAHGC